jgi:hypothetical protein
MLRSRQRSQSIVEFGIIAILFTLLLFAIADFGLLLNDWLSVSSGARQLGRDAAVGVFPSDIYSEAQGLKMPGVGPDAYFGGSYCCNVGTPGSALQVNITFYNQCTPVPGVGGCNPVNTATGGQAGLDSRYSSNGSFGHCDHLSLPPGQVCAHPAAPGPPNSCGGPVQCPGDSVVVTVTAAGAQVITPLVRPFFSNSTSCQSSSAHCYVALSSSVTMRFEGDTQ